MARLGNLFKLFERLPKTRDIEYLAENLKIHSFTRPEAWAAHAVIVKNFQTTMIAGLDK